MKRIKKMLLLLWDSIAAPILFLCLLATLIAVACAILFGLGYIVSWLADWNDPVRGADAVFFGFLVAWGGIVSIGLIVEIIRIIRYAWQNSKESE